MNQPVIALAMGDPSGIGPEILVKTLQNEEIRRACRPLVIGDPVVIGEMIALLQANLALRVIETPSDATFADGTIDLIRPASLPATRVEVGHVSPEGGKAATACLQEAYALAGAGVVRAVVSAPLNKQALHMAGYDYVDELDYLVAITHSAEPYVLGAVDTVWTLSVTHHIPFRDIAGAISKEGIVRSVANLHRALTLIGIEAPRIGVAALNPHGGEGGLVGREEIDVIAPAIAEAAAGGMAVTGPCAPDTVFVRARNGEFDGVVCMYHDQANIARKLLATMDGATIFMGLPVVYATTAHGTAYRKAGKGLADPTSLEAAVRYAVQLAAA